MVAGRERERSNGAPSKVGLEASEPPRFQPQKVGKSVVAVVVVSGSGRLQTGDGLVEAGFAAFGGLIWSWRDKSGCAGNNSIYPAAPFTLVSTTISIPISLVCSIQRSQTRLALINSETIPVIGLMVIDLGF